MGDMVCAPGKLSKSGRFVPEWVAAFFRNGWQVYAGISGRFEPDFAVFFDAVMDGPGHFREVPVSQEWVRPEDFTPKSPYLLLEIFRYR